MMSLLLVALCAGGDADAGGSYLYQPAYCLDEVIRQPARPYVPQPGDIMLATDKNMFWKVMHNLGGTGHPHHTGVVFARPDGSLAVLEAGPHDTTHIENLDWYPHYCLYEQKGRIWIRQRKEPLTPEQSACLTAFALAQEGKWFALGRLGQQLTVFRTRGPLRTEFVGTPYGPDRHSYFCSELGLEALVAAGALDAETTRPSATFPRDIFFDWSPNPYLKKHLNLSGCWYPPARFTSCPSACPLPVAPPADAPASTTIPPR
jgi:hypothetical protein